MLWRRSHNQSLVNFSTSSENSLISSNLRYTEANLMKATSSIFLRFCITTSPINLEGISLSPEDLISFFISSIKVSISSSPTGLYSKDLYNPSLSFCSSKGSLELSFCLMTLGIKSSAVSNVVNLSLHWGHSLLLLICCPSAINLESITFVSEKPQ